MLIVYALAASPPSHRGRGVSGERLQAITAARITAVVGTIRRAPRPTTAQAIRYDALMRRLAASTPALLPARFGTCVDDEAELRFILSSRNASLRRALRHVRNRAQMTIRIVGAAAVTRPARGDALASTRGSRSSGTAYLHARAAAAARERDIPGFQPLRAAVGRWVRDERVERRERIATVHHLVPRASVTAYARALRRAATDSPLHVVATGPYPPYAFAGWE